MTSRVSINGLSIARCLHELIVNEILPGTGVEADHFWAELETIVSEFSERNRALLNKRDRLQQSIDGWHQENQQEMDTKAYKTIPVGDRLPAA